MGHVWQGLLGMVIGMLIIIFRPQIKNFTGSIGFAERYFGIGGTWTFLAIFGGMVFILSLMWATGSFQEFVVEKVGRFF